MKLADIARVDGESRIFRRPSPHHLLILVEVHLCMRVTRQHESDGIADAVNGKSTFSFQRPYIYSEHCSVLFDISLRKRKNIVQYYYILPFRDFLLPLYQSVPADQHPTITRLMQGMYNSRPLELRYSSIRDVEIV